MKIIGKTWNVRLLIILEKWVSNKDTLVWREENIVLVLGDGTNIIGAWFFVNTGPLLWSWCCIFLACDWRHFWMYHQYTDVIKFGSEKLEVFIMWILVQNRHAVPMRNIGIVVVVVTQRDLVVWWGNRWGFKIDSFDKIHRSSDNGMVT